jgi:DNA-binding MarR family transcriptional regulator
MDNGGFSFASCIASDEEPVGSNRPGTGPSMRGRGEEPQFPTELVKLAKRIKAIRESRLALLDPSLFGEPAWNILLALYVAAGERYALSISALCAESGAPATTAARSINRLLELDMVRRVPNPSDNRSAYIELTGDTAARLSELLGEARSKYLAD